MKRRALRKDFYMEVKKSLNRFLSIFAIVAMGVAFYSGIQSAAPDMRYSGDAYFDAHQLMDLKVMGTMGLTDQDVGSLLEIDGIYKAEPGYMADVYWQGDEVSQVLRLESISPTLNRLTPLEGRAPKQPGEIFLDIEFARKQGLSPGDTVTFWEEEKEDGDPALKRHSFTLVGVGASPLYISFNRGNTNLGNGELAGAGYLLAEDFAYEAYTQIYLQVSGSDRLTAYTDAYEDMVTRTQEKIEEIATKRCRIRYEEIEREATEKITDGTRELEEGKEEAATELESAWQEIQEGEQELADGKQKLAEAEQELLEGVIEFEENEAKFQEEYPSAIKEIEEGEAALSEASVTLSRGWVSYEEGQEQFAEGERAVAEGRQQLAQARAKLDAGQREYESGMAQLAEKKKELQAGRAQFEATLQNQLQGATMAELDTLKEKYEEGKERIDRLSEAINRLEGELEVAREELDRLVQEGAPMDQTEAATQKVTALEGELQTQQSTLNGIVSNVDWQMLSGKWQQVAPYYDTLKSTERQLADGERQLAEGEGRLEGARVELEAGRSRLDAENARLEAGQRELDEKRPQLEEARKQLEDGEGKLSENAKKLKEGRKELEDAKQQLEDARAEIIDGQAEIDNAKQEIADGEKQLADGHKKLEDARTEIADAKDKLVEGRRELAEGREEYTKAKQDVEDEIAKAEAEIADAKKKLADLELPEWYVTDRSDLPDNIGYGENADRMRNIGQVFPALFFLVAALISLTTMTRMVEEERTQIGTLKALGYGNFAIASKYLVYALLATIGGSVAGILIGEKILPYIIISAYGIMYQHMTNIVVPYQISYGVFATAAALASTLLATWMACYKELAATPAVLMRPPTPKEGKRVLLEYLPFLWNRLSFSWKSTVRNLLRYKKRFFMTVFGISGCMALMIVGFGLRDSIMDIAILQYNQLQRYDAMLIGEEDLSREEKEKLLQEVARQEGVEGYACVQLKKVSVKEGRKEHSLYIIVPEETEGIEDFLCFRDRRTKEGYSLSEEGAILTEKLASMLNISAGGSLTLEDEDNHRFTVPVAAICENYMTHYLYMTAEVYEEIFGESPVFHEVMLRTGESGKAKLHEIGERLLGQKGVLSITYTDTIMGQLSGMLESLDIVIVVLIISAGMLAFVVLYNLTNININERRRELATIKVLGFYDQEVSAYVYRENILLTAIGILGGCLLGNLLHRFVIVTVEVDICMFGRNINWPSYLIAALFTAGFSFIVNVAMHFKLKKIDMVESLKSVE